MMLRGNRGGRLWGAGRLFGLQAEAVSREPRMRKNSRRTGVIGEKVGMTQVYDPWGFLHPVTVVRVADCHVVQVNRTTLANSNHKYVKLQVGRGTKKLKNATTQHVGHCAKAGLPPKRELYEFRVTPDAVLEPGTELRASHFLPGQLIDVRAKTTGKGTAGVMKRWGFSGGNASHGASKSHRQAGSIGNCQDPGKVWKGKKMAGRMGGKMTSHPGMQIMRVDPLRSLLFIKGSVPGPVRGSVYIRDAWLQPQNLDAPFPTYTMSTEDTYELMEAPASKMNPFNPGLIPPGNSPTDAHDDGAEDGQG